MLAKWYFLFTKCKIIQFLTKSGSNQYSFQSHLIHVIYGLYATISLSIWSISKKIDDRHIQTAGNCTLWVRVLRWSGVPKFRVESRCIDEWPMAFSLSHRYHISNPEHVGWISLDMNKNHDWLLILSRTGGPLHISSTGRHHPNTFVQYWYNIYCASL